MNDVCADTTALGTENKVKHTNARTRKIIAAAGMLHNYNHMAKLLATDAVSA